MNRNLWILLALALAATAVIGGVHWLGRRTAEQRLATYRYVISPAPGDGKASAPHARAAYEEGTALHPRVASPQALAVDGANRIIVAGTSNLTVLSREGIVLRDVPLDRPAWCLAVDDAGNIYVGHRQAVSVVDAEGVRPPERWTGFGEQARLTSLAVRNQELFVADAGQRTVWRMDLEGRLRGRMGDGGFSLPGPYFDVLADEEHVWIVNPGRLRVERYAPDGTFQGAWGQAGMDLKGFCGCCNPIHLARLPTGEFVTAEKGLARIKILDREGALVALVAGPDAFDGGAFAANEPARIADLAVDAQGRVLALDRATERVRVFTPRPRARDTQPEGLE